MHWLTAFGMERRAACLKKWLPGGYFGSKTP
jgi:hypothetical protein